MKLVKNFKALGWFWVFLIGKIGVCQHWKYTQECRSDIVLGKTNAVESDSNNWIDNFVCLLRKYFISSFFYICLLFFFELFWYFNTIAP